MRTCPKRLGALCLALFSWTSAAQASPYRLRGDALVQLRDPSGVLALDGRGEVTPELGVEVMMWGAAGGVDGAPNPEADLLVAALSYRDALGRGEVRAGRLVVTSGALWPVHMDGIVATGRLPTRTSLEVFGGIPVVPRFGTRAFDWAIGGRLAQSFGNSTVGLGYLQERTAGMLDRHELGLDMALFPVESFDLGARAALDLARLGLAELVGTAAYTRGLWRLEAYGSHREVSHLLPATSLFTVLGDQAQTGFGGRVEVRAAPRLLVAASGGARVFDTKTYEDFLVMGRLMLGPERGSGSVGLELRRQGAPLGGWTGARAFARFPIIEHLSGAVELELVHPDVQDRGDWWPWALISASWQFLPSWELSAAAEANASAASQRSFDAILRLSYLWSDV
ncbi:MAG: hypothetical protein U1E65_16440 [Myxococcota bacterium]